MSPPEPLKSLFQDLLEDPKYITVGRILADSSLPLIDVPKSDRLREMMKRQYDFQMHLGHYPPGMSDEERAQYIKNQSVALVAEVYEALDEVGWKEWTTSRHFNRDAFVGELIDVLHFLLNLFMAAEVDPSELVARFHAKNQVNWDRQKGEYDGVSTKCKTCRRALDEPNKAYGLEALKNGFCTQVCQDNYQIAG